MLFEVLDNQSNMTNQCYDKADSHTRVGKFEVDSRDGDHRWRLVLGSSLFCYIDLAPKHLVIPFLYGQRFLESTVHAQ